ncbi:MAG: TlpA family protein disulfide reductase [Proteobacteria bacterium]|nr:TlpA family protein disulfide reductase [Pseudomonadota bacterium]
MKANTIKLFTLLLPILFLLSVTAEAARKPVPAPDFTLTDSTGKEVSLGEHRGKVVFIDFWASWCGPCKEEFPEINSFLAKYDPSEVVGLAININKKQSHADAFLDPLGSLSKNLILLFDPSAKVIPLYKASAMPTSFIVDKEGLIRHIHFGYNKGDPEKWVAEIDALISEKGSTVNSK